MRCSASATSNGSNPDVESIATTVISVPVSRDSLARSELIESIVAGAR
jgi:hypothetical protein